MFPHAFGQILATLSRRLGLGMATIAGAICASSSGEANGCNIDSLSRSSALREVMVGEFALGSFEEVGLQRSEGRSLDQFQASHFRPSSFRALLPFYEVPISRRLRPCVAWRLGLRIDGSICRSRSDYAVDWVVQH
ncbi:hypothetical protein BCR34DRAFT_566346 [Clohesyomyces aquaticus]|uniref:Uncharacterized protein n=1 Tax=Clohesyomyces aquaticus TaxID=1231657 RepID=A0A1Y1ZKG7_9PLEO|nr:hypothetical protein BCR34DRAFT_566346 [Clohesyomyces aquaticus]